MTNKKDTKDTYEYAGFVYQLPDFTPVAGQHPAASKEKHRRAARECYEDGQPSLNTHLNFPKVG